MKLLNKLRKGSESFHYSLRSCALHHGSGMEICHYTALIFEDEKVLYVDDTKCQATSQWQLISQQTVYLAFFTKDGNGLTLYSQVSLLVNYTGLKKATIL